MADVRFRTRGRVVAYSGYRANERPLRFTLEGRGVEVRQVLRQWIEEEHDCFQVLAADNKIYILAWERSSDEWWIVKPGEKI